MGFIKVFLISFFLLPSIGVAYPWVSLKHSSQKSYFQLDISSSYFLKEALLVSGGGDLEYHNSKIDIDLGYRYSFLEKEHYFRFGELSVILPIAKDVLNLHLGFRDFVWSESDRYWNLGLWQPRYLLDPFRPIQTSLPGLYLDYFGGATSATFYLSYFYIPDIIIFPEISNGKPSSKNPFFLNNYPSHIDWKVGAIRDATLSDFVKPLIGFQVEHSVSASDFFLSYAYKPKNQVQYLIKFQSLPLSENTTSSAGNLIPIEGLDYAIVHHHLLTLESKVHLSEHFSLFGSLFYEAPQKLGEKELEGQGKKGWISGNFESYLIASAMLYFTEETTGVEKTTFTFGYLKSFLNVDQRGRTNILTSSLSSSFDWKHAVSWSLEYWTTELFKEFQFNFRLNYALDDRVYNVIFDTFLSPFSSFQVYLSGDVLFSFSEGEQKQEDLNSFSSRYKDLSRILLGVRYVF